MSKAIDLSIAAPGITCQRQVSLHVATNIDRERLCATDSFGVRRSFVNETRQFIERWLSPVGVFAQAQIPAVFHRGVPSHRLAIVFGRPRQSGRWIDPICKPRTLLNRSSVTLPGLSAERIDFAHCETNGQHQHNTEEAFRSSHHRGFSLAAVRSAIRRFGGASGAGGRNFRIAGNSSRTLRR